MSSLPGLGFGQVLQSLPGFWSTGRRPSVRGGVAVAMFYVAIANAHSYLNASLKQTGCHGGSR